MPAPIRGLPLQHGVDATDEGYEDAARTRAPPGRRPGVDATDEGYEDAARTRAPPGRQHGVDATDEGYEDAARTRAPPGKSESIMDATLAVVAIVSLLLAWAMAIVSWQRVRAERRRSDSRVATLMAELAALPVLRGRPTEPPEHAGSMTSPAATAGGSPARGGAHLEPRLPFGAPDWGRPDPAGGAPPAGSRAEPAAGDAEGGDAPRGAPPRYLSYLRRAVLAPMPSARARWRHGAVAVATVLVAVATLAERTPRPGDGAAAPVELLSLDHRRQGDYLAVSGSLRNPPDGRERTRLSISATAFDRTGAIVGTGQTPLPIEALPPGEETAFDISLPDADLISRYRVSFMEDQSGLPHVDRRGSDAAPPAAAGRRP